MRLARPPRLTQRKVGTRIARLARTIQPQHMREEQLPRYTLRTPDTRTVPQGHTMQPHLHMDLARPLRITLRKVATRIAGLVRTIPTQHMREERLPRYTLRTLDTRTVAQGHTMQLNLRMELVLPPRITLRGRHHPSLEIG